MELIQRSAEHYFLTTLEKRKTDASHWYGLYFSLSKALKHHDLVSDLSKLSQKIQTAKAKSDVLAEEVYNALKDQFEGSVCVFADTDIFVFVKAEDKMKKKILDEVFKNIAKKLPSGFSDMDGIGNQFRSYMKLADENLLSAKRMDAYEHMTDENKVASISARRKRRDDPVVLVVEDDRFTAHYASNILSGDFDFVLSRDGEDAVQTYIEHAPDIVFLDIHLPGLTGHEVLQSINAVDPKAFVVMLSVDSVQDNIVRASQMGARKFLKKPFTKERLIETVKNSPYVRELTRSDRAGSETLLH